MGGSRADEGMGEPFSSRTQMQPPGDGVLRGTEQVLLLVIWFPYFFYLQNYF